MTVDQCSTLKSDTFRRRSRPKKHRRRRADDGEAEQTRRARRGREQDFAEISRRMYEEIRSSSDPRHHVEDGQC